MIKKEFLGVITPVLTLFDETGKINEKEQRKLITFLVDAGVHGLFVAGSFGSGLIMTKEEMKKVLEISLDEAKNRIPCIAHVGSADTQTTIDMAKYAEEIGYSAVSAVPPFYYTYHESDILAHYSKLVNSINIPVFAYNNPHTTGVLLTNDMLVSLAKDGLKGVKDSTLNMESFIALSDKVESEELDFQCIIGTDSFWVGAQLSGAKAMVAGMSNIFPEFVVDFYNTSLKDDLNKTEKLQKKSIRLRNIMRMALRIPIPNYLAVLEMRGFKVGIPKAPFSSIDTVSKEKIYKDLVNEGMGESLKL